MTRKFNPWKEEQTPESAPHPRSRPAFDPWAVDASRAKQSSQLIPPPVFNPWEGTPTTTPEPREELIPIEFNPWAEKSTKSPEKEPIYKGPKRNPVGMIFKSTLARVAAIILASFLPIFLTPIIYPLIDPIIQAYLDMVEGIASSIAPQGGNIFEALLILFFVYILTFLFMFVLSAAASIGLTTVAIVLGLYVVRKMGLSIRRSKSQKAILYTTLIVITLIFGWVYLVWLSTGMGMQSAGVQGSTSSFVGTFWLLEELPYAGFSVLIQLVFLLLSILTSALVSGCAITMGVATLVIDLSFYTSRKRKGSPVMTADELEESLKKKTQKRLKKGTPTSHVPLSSKSRSLTHEKRRYE